MTVPRKNNNDLPHVEKYDSLNGTWDFLKDGALHILDRLDEGMSITRYMELYTAIHNYCADASKTMSVESFSDQTANVLGEALYNNLVLYLKEYLTNLRLTSLSEATHEDRLAAYAKYWTRFTTSSRFLHHLFGYLNRYWVKLKNRFSDTVVYDIYTLCLVSWYHHVFAYICDDILTSLLYVFNRKRSHEPVDMKDVKVCVDSITSLSFDKADMSKANLNSYKAFFESRFISSSREYYATESSQYISTHSITDYLGKAESRLSEEEELVHLYLHESTLKPLLEAVEDELITKHSEVLHNDFSRMLDENCHDDIVRMYRLMSRTPNGLQPLRKSFEDFVKRSGFLAVARIAPEGDKVSEVDPKDYLESLLSTYLSSKRLVEDAFQGDADFTKSLDTSCREIINRNVVCQPSSSRSPELLAKYSDSVLRKNSKAAEVDDIENILSSIIIIFRYVEDKDVFQNFYTKLLAKRLVNGMSNSQDAESGMLSKLKEVCGFEYTSKLQRMFQDISLSQELTDSFRQLPEMQKSPIDFYAMVLGTSFWPLTASSSSFHIPPELKSLYERFESYYNTCHSGRKLSWLFHLSKGEIKARINPNSTTTYVFQVSTFQMAVLLLYNKSDSYKYEELIQLSGLNHDILVGILNIFLRAKVLLLEEGKKLGEPESVYTINKNFKMKKIRVQLNLPIKSEQKQEVVETQKTIEEDRKLLLQSAIVRIMKARRTLKHVVLVKETIDQIKSRFAPQVSDIKRCIDMLIEKEYLERQGRDEYVYLA
ncbi:Cullin 1 [Schizosaccharomyces cryophilus OY26]|uniref:Cullin 1 n=1 Tax=Schizosaccharomyces cryophilus (strain OY26 / ATCC MYA-4695 / CBS 11777 / NBRC 106824 / NRRL Y48691) TaxID=653667 RepID=S9W445_SCHCR|nr:Cullin 1 [Schizosaccharomyces cryophilus OY26]EPY52785.1 Cullin 1 [Schizosaccharomyces cryophilus OY26]